ncbi:MAG TPA: efflux RND transporter permease subunit, partial [Gemmataceae bacterium]|nr:efflux RND transporter permease subunit [Gemmataceae bacterium]
RYDSVYMSNFATIQLKDELARVDGVGDLAIFGQQDYSMRLWVDPDKLAALNLTAGDVLAAVREQNMQVAGGQVGQPPQSNGQEFEFTVHILGRLSDPSQFADIVLKTGPNGQKVRLRDIGHVELGARNKDVSSKIDEAPCASIAIWQLPYANALNTADNVRAKIRELQKSFPEGINYAIAFDTTPYIQESINGVLHTLTEAIILVAVVVLVFLQSWRSTIIPLTAVPVAIIGTFGAMIAIGFSLNNLTLFGLVLAIGIVVDDAIVVVEAVEHHIEEGMAPRAAAIKAMQEVSGPVIAVALVLSAVFVPCAFISGITGQFFRQFALTIAVSTVLSAFNSLTLSPALAAILLKPRAGSPNAPPAEALPWWAYVIAGAAAPVALHWVFPVVWPSVPHQFFSMVGDSAAWPTGALAWLGWLRLSAELAGYLAVVAAPGAVAGWLLSRPVDYLLRMFFTGFNWSFRRVTGLYTRLVGLVLRGSVIVLLVYGGLLLLTWWTSRQLPTGYIPLQDQGRLYAAIQLPDSASLERTQQVVDHVSDIAMHTPGVAHTLAVAGQSFTLQANGSNFGNIFITLDEFEKRRKPELYSDDIAAELRKKIAKEVPEAIVTILGPPAVNGLGSAGGFKFIVEDRTGNGDLMNLQRQTLGVIAAAKDSKKVAGLLTVFKADAPQLYVDLDRKQCETMGVNPNDVFTTLQVYLGSYYVNDFNKFGRTWQVVVQCDGPFRNDLSTVKRLRVRNAAGGMVPLGDILKIREQPGPLILMRYNMYPAAGVVGGTKPGVSSGEGIAEMERLARQTLGQGMGYEWTEINYIQVKAEQDVGNNLIFPLAVVFVFLVLAAQYESWALPLAVILVVPMCILGSLTGVATTHWAWLYQQLFHTPPSKMDINIFTQIGFVVLVGLASKNAILIVEFAKHKRESGLSRRDATLAAVQLRLRPILMTSFAFILGVLPLMLAIGAGSEMRRALGVAVFSGMLGVTLFGIFLTPVFFYVIEYLAETPVFASARVRLAGRIMLLCLGAILAGVPWLIVYVTSQLRRRPVVRGKSPPIQPNGRKSEASRQAFAVEGNESDPDGNGRPSDGPAAGDQPTLSAPRNGRRDDDPDPDRILSK